MQENSQNTKSKAIEQALASLHFDDIDVAQEYLKEYIQKQEIELESSEKNIVKTLSKKEGE